MSNSTTSQPERALENEFFLRGEYFKRHFEDNADMKTIEWLKNNCCSQPRLDKFTLSDKITIIRECIFKRDKETKGEEYIPNIEIPFNTDKKRKWVKRLHDISLEYKAYAPELLLPYDFIDVLTKINASIHPFRSRVFLRTNRMPVLFIAIWLYSNCKRRDSS